MFWPSLVPVNLFLAVSWVGLGLIPFIQWIAGTITLPKVSAFGENVAGGDLLEVGLGH